MPTSSIHLSYQDTANSALKYAFYDGNWTITTVDNEGYASGHSSIAVDHLGLAHIAYHDGYGNSLKYATVDSNGRWTNTTVDDLLC